MAKDDEKTKKPSEDDSPSVETSVEEDASEASEETRETEETDEAETAESRAEDDSGAADETSAEEEAHAAATLGATRYVHAAFFAAAILAAYVASKVIVLAWGAIAEWPAAVRAVPQLVAYAEDQREGIALGAGAVMGTLVVIQSYRKESVRGWADDVAGELARVTWPSRETVVNGTIVVVLASAIATVYVTILDRFWSFLTTLVYGA
jgi:preprotein translocase subunit SecE